MYDEYVSVKEAAVRTGKSEVYIRRIIHGGHVSYRYQGRKYVIYVHMGELVEYLNSRRGAARREEKAYEPEPGVFEEEPVVATVEMPRSWGDALKFLGLSDTVFVDPDVAKKAYRRAAMKNHPDVGGNEELMKAINVAYSILSRGW